jgi:peptidoglycan/LPS O-acetylase OafA/YrhL
MPAAAVSDGIAPPLWRKRNNFDVVRLLLAYTVAIGHIAFLYGAPHFETYYAIGDLAVPAFFVISGFLVSMSYEASTRLTDYYTRRLLRIYPLYIFVVASQGAIMAALLAQRGAGPPAGELGRYLLANGLFANFLAPSIDGIFDGLRNHAVNGSLWTLKIEVGFYLLLPALAAAVRAAGARILVAIIILSAAYALLAQRYVSDELARQLPGQLRFFAVGMLLYGYHEPLARWSRFFLPLGLSAVALALLTRWNAVFFAFAYPLLVGAAAYGIAFGPGLWRPRRDISYGVYLLHFPTIQLLLYFGAGAWELWRFAAIVLVLVTLLALLAHHMIERPAIELGKRLIAARMRRAAAL